VQLLALPSWHDPTQILTLCATTNNERGAWATLWYEGDFVPILLDGEFAVVLPFSAEVCPWRFDLARAAIAYSIRQ
jgi:hypothetical protein